MKHGIYEAEGMKKEVGEEREKGMECGYERERERERDRHAHIHRLWTQVHLMDTRAPTHPSSLCEGS
jgi:hypothetical protein